MYTNRLWLVKILLVRLCVSLPIEGSSVSIWDAFENEVEGTFNTLTGGVPNESTSNSSRRPPPLVPLMVNDTRNDSTSDSSRRPPPSVPLLVNVTRNDSTSFSWMSDISESVTDMAKNVSKYATNGYEDLTFELPVIEKSAETLLKSSYSKASTEISDAAKSTESFLNTKYLDVSKDVVAAENKFTSGWNTVKSTMSTAADETGAFFSSGWNKCRKWWGELEDNVKDFIHLIIKIVDIFIGIAVFVFVFWVVKKVRQAYNIVERHTALPMIV